MTGHCGGIAENNQFHPGTGNGDIHSAKVTEKAYLPFFVGTYKGDEDDVALLSLKTVDGIDTNKTTIGLEELFFLKKAPQILHLSTIGGNDAHVKPLVKDSLLAYLLEILLEDEQGEFCLSLIDTPETLPYELFLKDRGGRREECGVRNVCVGVSSLLPPHSSN